ncbi:MAG TPA: hypothetical protein VIJ39_08150 [Solirubrobacteraceae bacterium]
MPALPSPALLLRYRLEIPSWNTQPLEHRAKRHDPSKHPHAVGSSPADHGVKVWVGEQVWKGRCYLFALGYNSLAVGKIERQHHGVKERLIDRPARATSAVDTPKGVATEKDLLNSFGCIAKSSN